MGMDISPMCDRYNATIEKSQVIIKHSTHSAGLDISSYRWVSLTTSSIPCGRPGPTSCSQTPRTSSTPWRRTGTGTRARSPSARATPAMSLKRTERRRRKSMRNNRRMKVKCSDKTYFVKACHWFSLDDISHGGASPRPLLRARLFFYLASIIL